MKTSFENSFVHCIDKLYIMKKLLLIFITLIFSSSMLSQNIPNKWDELVASDWELALKKSNYTCILPIGILEKHGPEYQ